VTDEADPNLLIPRAALLADGSVTRIRPLAPEDAPALTALNERLSERSFYLRYFTLGRRTADHYVAHPAERRPRPSRAGCRAAR
jgi:hypothetical protein